MLKVWKKTITLKSWGLKKSLPLNSPASPRPRNFWRPCCHTAPVHVANAASCHCWAPISSISLAFQDDFPMEDVETCPGKFIIFPKHGYGWCSYGEKKKYFSMDLDWPWVLLRASLWRIALEVASQWFLFCLLSGFGDSLDRKVPRNQRSVQQIFHFAETCLRTNEIMTPFQMDFVPWGNPPNRIAFFQQHHHLTGPVHQP